MFVCTYCASSSHRCTVRVCCAEMIAQSVAVKVELEQRGADLERAQRAQLTQLVAVQIKTFEHGKEQQRRLCCCYTTGACWGIAAAWLQRNETFNSVKREVQGAELRRTVQQL